MKNFFLFACLIAFTNVLCAQKFVTPASAFSHKKTAYVTLNDGTELVGVIRDLDRKKGLIEEIKMTLNDGSKKKITPSQIKHAYLPQSNLSKYGNAMDVRIDDFEADYGDLDNALLGDDYAFFESSVVRLGKKTRTLLLQLMNPAFSGRVRVYEDPFAKETASIGVAGVTVAGGLDKSYFIKVGDTAAYKVKKKDYKEEYPLIFKGCDAVLKHEDAGTWNAFERQVYLYAKECNK